MKYIFTLLIICTACSINAQKPSLPVFNYVITVLPKQQQFSISLRFQTRDVSSTAIQLPDHFGEFQKAYRFVSIQKGININDIKLKEGDSSIAIVYHKPNQLITFNYVLKNALKDSLPGREPAYSIIIKPNYFNIPGQVLFAYPKNDSSSIAHFKIEWKKLPAGWSSINSFGKNVLKQTVNALRTDQFVSSIWAGGDYRVYSFEVNQKPVHFAVRGNWQFKDADMFSMIKKTIAAQRAFWNDYNINQYTVTLMPFLTDNEYSMSYQGTGLTNSFATWATSNRNTSPASLMYLYNHELMHHWIGGIIENEQPEELLYWFSEGFTEYYTWRNMLESKFISEVDYKRSFDSVLAIHYSDPDHSNKNTAIKENFWTNYKFQKLPYNRGRIFAFYLDALIQKQTAGIKNLKTVMLELLNICKEQEQKQKLTKSLFIETVKKVTGMDINAAYEKFIEQGNFISLEEWNEAGNNGFAYKQVNVFTYGFTTDKGGIEGGAKIISLDEEANAAKAGLQVSDVLRGFNISNNPNSEAELTVERNKEIIRLKFFPAKTKTLLQLK